MCLIHNNIDQKITNKIHREYLNANTFIIYLYSHFSIREMFKLYTPSLTLTVQTHPMQTNRIFQYKNE